jgi:hypothetical protein
LLLAGCASDTGLRLRDWAQSAPSGVLVYVDTDDDLESGVVIGATDPFMSFTLVMTAPAGSVFSMRAPLANGELGPWQPVVIDEDLGTYKNGHQVLPGPVDFVELRASEGATFIQATLFEGTTPLYDDDPGSSDTAARTATPGMWMMSPESWEIAQQQYLEYTSAVSCTGSLTAGARALGDFLVGTFEATSYGGYNCR